jgi:hypothetical protein
VRLQPRRLLRSRRDTLRLSSDALVTSNAAVFTADACGAGRRLGGPQCDLWGP